MRKATLFLATVLSGLLHGVGCACREQQDQAAIELHASSTTYKWVDEKGVTHYGDTSPPNIRSANRRVLNSQGVEVQKQPGGDVAGGSRRVRRQAEAKKRAASSTTCS